MKEIKLTLTKKNELSFEKPDPYITIHIATKEAYEKLVDVINKNNAPMEVDIETDYKLNDFKTRCPVCKTMLSHGNTAREAMLPDFVHYCLHCGQRVYYNSREV